MKKRYIVIVILLICIVAITNIPLDFHKEIDAIEIKLDDDEYCINRRITYNGKYYINLFADDKFEGRCRVSGYENMPEEHMSFRITSTGDRMIYEAEVSTDNTWGEFAFGRCFSDRFINNAVIAVFNENLSEPSGGNNGYSYSTANATCIVIGEKNNEAARGFAEQILGINS